MDAENIKILLDACFAAKKITETMKELPEGFKPRHIHVIDCIATVQGKKGSVCVSDVSEKLGITAPSVTKLIQELESNGAVEKYSIKEDKRVILLRLTSMGEEFLDQYVTKYHTRWAENMQGVTKEEVDIAVSVIYKMKRAMPKRGHNEQ